MSTVIGIDPGTTGCLYVVNNHGILDCVRFKDKTDHDLFWALDAINQKYSIDKVLLEKVHSMPKQGVASTFKFGERYGFIKGLITALRWPFEYVTPNKWQKALSCQTKGDKKISKAAAQRLFPDENLTLDTADALLIAEYGRRDENETRKSELPTSQ